MIEDYILYFIIMLLLTFLFESRILPQLAVMGLVLILTSQHTFTTSQSSAYPIILYSINFIYAFVSIVFVTKIEDENE